MYEVRRANIARAILEYLSKNPHAQDTLEGIYQWWLPQERIRTSRRALHEVLDELVARKLILESKRRDSQIHYRINTHRSQDIETVLKRTGR